MTLRREAEIGGNRRKRFVGITEQAFCLLRFLFQNVVRKGCAGLLMKTGGQMRAADIELSGDLLCRDRPGEVVLNVV